MIFLTRAGDEDRLGLWVLLGRFVLLSGNRKRNRNEERYAERERRKQASHVKPPERKGYLVRLYRAGRAENVGSERIVRPSLDSLPAQYYVTPRLESMIVHVDFCVDVGILRIDQALELLEKIGRGGAI